MANFKQTLPMPAAYRIRVDQPCTEDWNAMPVKGNGRHCASCARTLVDFSDFTDAELVAFIHNNPGTCGRFRSRQLNRLMYFGPAPKRQQALPKWVAGTLLVVATHSAAAQQQLSPELPKCDDSLAAVDLRLDGFVPLADSVMARADSMQRADSALSDSVARACRKISLDSLVARYVQDSVRFTVPPQGLDSSFTFGFAVMERVDIPWSDPMWEFPHDAPAEEATQPELPRKAVAFVPPLPTVPQPAPTSPLAPLRIEALLPRQPDGVEEDETGE